MRIIAWLVDGNIAEWHTPATEIYYPEGWVEVESLGQLRSSPDRLLYIQASNITGLIMTKEED